MVFVKLDDSRDFFDISAVNQEDVPVVAGYAETEEMMTSKEMISKPFCPK